MTNKDQAEKLRGILGRTFYDRENGDIDYLYEVARERLAQLEAEPVDCEALRAWNLFSYKLDHEGFIKIGVEDICRLRLHKETIRRALTQTQGCNVPDGWKLVPVTPTNEMFIDPDTICTNYGQSPWEAFCDVYQAILSAAPQPDKGE